VWLDTHAAPGDFGVADRSASREGKVLLAVIPARYDSVRLPGKPLADIGGAPMVVRVWLRARTAVDRCLIATDDERIASACEAWGAEVVRTGPCASGTDRVAEAVAGLGLTAADVVVNVQGDEPLIPPASIRAVALGVDDAWPIATASAPMEGDASDPSRVKVVTSARGAALYFSRQPIPTGGPYALHLGLYAFRPDVLASIRALPVSPLERAERLEQLRWLEAGLPIRVVPVSSSPPAVDTPADLERVRALVAADPSLSPPGPRSSP